MIEENSPVACTDGRRKTEGGREGKRNGRILILLADHDSPLDYVLIPKIQARMNNGHSAEETVPSP